MHANLFFSVCMHSTLTSYITHLKCSTIFVAWPAWVYLFGYRRWRLHLWHRKWYLPMKCLNRVPSRWRDKRRNSGHPHNWRLNFTAEILLNQPRRPSSFLKRKWKYDTIVFKMCCQRPLFYEVSCHLVGDHIYTYPVISNSLYQFLHDSLSWS